ncbi:MAG: ABC transporter substrate-binding protein [Rhizobiaceae bacterium]|nr:ABC transporter substrate-binding protein [Rhizobiaceae bacterium]
MAALVAASTAFALVQGSAAEELKKVTFRMDWVPSGIYAAFYNGKVNGFYEKAGFDVEIMPGNGSTATMDGLISGELDFGFVSCWGMSVGVSKGRSVVSVATFTGRNGFGFFFPKDAGVTRLADLKNKSIVASPSSMDTLLYPAVLVGAGLPADMLKQINVEPAQKVPTYARGQADVVVSHIPYADPIIEQQRPSGHILWSDEGFVLPDFCIAVSRARLESDPQGVEKFIRATFEATEDAASNPDKAAAAGVSLFPVLTQEQTKAQWKLMTTLFYTEDTKSCPHGWHSASDWTKGLEVLQKYGGLEGSIDDHAKFYTNQFFTCDR